jgi:putative endonuclease
MAKTFIVYMMCSMKNGTFYTGVTSNPAARMWQHKSGFFAKSFTAQYNVKRLVWYEVHYDASAAIQREKRIKDWQREWKKRLVEEMNPDWRDLSEDLMGF